MPPPGSDIIDVFTTIVFIIILMQCKRIFYDSSIFSNTIVDGYPVPVAIVSTTTRRSTKFAYTNCMNLFSWTYFTTTL